MYPGQEWAPGGGGTSLGEQHGDLDQGRVSIKEELGRFQRRFRCKDTGLGEPGSGNNPGRL